MINFYFVSYPVSSYTIELASACDLSNGGDNGTFSYFDNRCASVEEICSRFDLSYVGDRRHQESNFTQCNNGTHDIPLDKVRRKKT